jgi:hypothetical protein
MPWVESTLNITNGYYNVTSSEGDQLEYLVPFPAGYTSTMKAHWTTDVIVLDPSCSWQTATAKSYLNNSSWDVVISKANFSIALDSSNLGMFLLSFNVFHIFIRFQYQAIAISRKISRRF